MSMSSRRAGECVAGSTRLAWWIGEEPAEEKDGEDDEEEAAGETSMSNMFEGGDCDLECHYEGYYI